MAQDITTLYRLASTNAGSRSDISGPTDNKREVDLCNLYFPIVRDYVFGACRWPSLKKAERPAIATEREDDEADWELTDPDPNWKYAYKLPTDCIRPRNLRDFDQFELGTWDQLSVLYCNVEDAILFYTHRQTNMGLWEPELFLTITLALSAYICIPLNGNASKAARNSAQANDVMLESRTRIANAEHREFESIPPWLSARGVSSNSMARFFYQDGPLLTITAPAATNRHAG